MGIDDRIEESKNWAERAMEKVPGYSGYKEKETTREADKTQRLYIAETLEPCLGRLDELKLDLLKAGKLDAMGDADVSMRKLRRVRDRVQFADYGYSGLFDSAKAGSQTLQQLYDFDKALEGDAAGIRDMVNALAADSPSLSADIKLLDDRIEALDGHFTERDHLITGAGR